MGNPKQKVMVIEDDPEMVSLLTTLLKLEGFIVKTPENHQMKGVLDAIINEQPLIALVDVNLAIGSGLDLVREIRLDPGLAHTSILMASGQNLKRECIQAGADGFIMKPFMPDELLNLIHKTIKNSTEQQTKEIEYKKKLS